ncbi:MAG: 50S ribosomal protein L4 [Candidatus Nanoarchaeia archaeon]|nr:50S ribosomal protein L4 [Candidatus Nanoarchaeia archaeon]
MKIQILDTEGKKAKEITTSLFEEPIREDLIFKIIEAQKTRQPYKPKQYAGMDRSASGNVLHTRHDWKTDRGRGMSRFPKKTMWRRGTQFSWVGAIIPSVKGGRRAHPPHGFIKFKKINKKELKKAMLSALTYITSIEEIKKKYHSLENKKIEINLPLVVEDKILKLKSKEFFKNLKHILGNLYEISIQKKSTRAGIGKMRGRRYSKNAGLLLVIGKEEKIKITGIDVINANKLKIADLADGGARLTMFTEKAIKELEGLKNN